MCFLAHFSSPLKLPLLFWLLHWFPSLLVSDNRIIKTLYCHCTVYQTCGTSAMKRSFQPTLHSSMSQILQYSNIFCLYTKSRKTGTPEYTGCCHSSFKKAGILSFTHALNWRWFSWLFSMHTKTLLADLQNGVKTGYYFHNERRGGLLMGWVVQ